MLAFQGVFFGALSLFGLVSLAPIPIWSIIGVICIFPFLTITLVMLRFQIGLQRRMRRTARTDELTGLPNRRAFIESMEETLQHHDCVVMMVDVDHFKAINDTLGHAFGDKCLVEMANALRPLMPRAYELARLGGEEFGIVMFNASRTQAETVGRRLVNGTKVENSETGREHLITNSVGIAFRTNGESLSELLSRADHALYRAKSNGRARFEIWGESDDQSMETTAAA